jgi:hypothetical protein
MNNYPVNAACYAKNTDWDIRASFVGPADFPPPPFYQFKSAWIDAASNCIALGQDYGKDVDLSENVTRGVCKKREWVGRETQKASR